MHWHLNILNYQHLSKDWRVGKSYMVEGKAKCRAKRPTLSSCHEYSTRNTTSWPLPTFGRTLCSVHGLRALLLFDASEKVPSEVDNKSIETRDSPDVPFCAHQFLFTAQVLQESIHHNKSKRYLLLFYCNP
jgi:hypothetical protein